MKIMLEPTNKIVMLVTDKGDVPARIWEGTTDDGTLVFAYVTRVAAKMGEHDEALFKRVLSECRNPIQAGPEMIPMRLIL